MYGLLGRREIQGIDTRFICKASTGLHFLQRMKLERKLCVHNGCVNTICWNEKGTLILSGSDDQHLAITDPFLGKNLVKFRSGHRSNIFSAKFMPSSMDKEVVSCSGSGEIFYTDIDREDTYGANRFDCHFGSTYKLLVVPNEAATFLSCGDDGTVRFFDLRTKTSCSKFSCEEDVLIHLRNAVTSMAVDPVIPYQLAISSSDGIVRLYDRRMLKPRDTHAMNDSLIFKFPPPMASIEQGGSNGGRQRYYRVTSLNFRPGSHDLLVNYSSENIYLFNTYDIKQQMKFSASEAAAQTTATCKVSIHASKGSTITSKRAEASPTGSSVEASSIKYPTKTSTPPSDDGSDSDSSPFKPIKRLRLRGDWSDTGPDAHPENEEPALTNNIMQRMSDLLTRMINNRTERGQADTRNERVEAREGQQEQSGENAPEALEEQEHSTPGQRSAAREEAASILRSVIYGSGQARTALNSSEREVTRTSISSEGMVSSDLSPQDVEIPAPSALGNDSECLQQLSGAGPTESSLDLGELDGSSRDQGQTQTSALLDHLSEKQQLLCQSANSNSDTDLLSLNEGKSGMKDEFIIHDSARLSSVEAEPVMENEVQVSPIDFVHEEKPENAEVNITETSTDVMLTDITSNELVCGQESIEVGHTVSESHLYHSRVPMCENAENNSFSSSSKTESSPQTVILNSTIMADGNTSPVSKTDQHADCQFDKPERTEKVFVLDKPGETCMQKGMSDIEDTPDAKSELARYENISENDASVIDEMSEDLQIIASGAVTSDREAQCIKGLTQKSVPDTVSKSVPMFTSAGSGAVELSHPTQPSSDSSSLSADSFSLASLWSSSSVTGVAIAEDGPGSTSQQTLNDLSTCSLASSVTETTISSQLEDKDLLWDPNRNHCPSAQTQLPILSPGEEQASQSLSFLIDDSSKKEDQSIQEFSGKGQETVTVGSKDNVAHFMTLSDSMPVPQRTTVKIEASDVQMQRENTLTETLQGKSNPSSNKGYQMNISSQPHKPCTSCHESPFVEGKGKGKGKSSEKQNLESTHSSSKTACFTPYNSGKMKVASDDNDSKASFYSAGTSSGSGGFKKESGFQSSGSERQRRYGHSLPPTGEFQLYGPDDENDDDDDDEYKVDGEHLSGRNKTSIHKPRPDKEKMSQAASKIQEMFRQKREAREQARMMRESQPKVFMKYSGHRNCRTMIKEANFYGDSFVMSGSDCGRILFWERETGQLVMYLDADKHVVNCVQPNPYAPILASSGIDYDVKIWSPSEQDCQFDELKATEIIQRNERMLEVTRDTVTVPAAFMLRILASLSQMRNGGNTSREQENASEPSSNQD
ncbi:Ddb1- and cul4-associated factor 6-like [Plakobranchus ocellatus]|uniref:Ddb1- and cul4-associated factor 6-like n=1 Tax=Plakobranchus ocellatus TaxID=259542 RepID=A0AAV3Y6T1_9GAST|nr:Ddb1- and cul4-associated factor 6-like [Plakobranchus ocellatus]